MKIALLITDLGMGGAENQVVSLADRFAALGHSVLLIALTGNILVSPRDGTVKVICLNMHKTPLSFWSTYFKARRLLREFKPDVLHSHMVHANIFARLLRLTVPLSRLICTAHSSNEGGVARILAYRLTDFLATISSNVSHEAMMRSIQRGAVTARKIMAVQNGIDCDRFQPNISARKNVRLELKLPDETQAFLAVGRFTEAKDYSNLLIALTELSRKRTDWTLWIAGAGAEQPIFEALTERLGIGHKVLFLGLRRDIPALMAAADIFVLSSAWEGLPLVVGEAMACERVVVSTDAGGIKEWLGNLGFVVPIRDSVALSAALSQSLSMSHEEKRLQGRMGRERVIEHYSLDAVVDRWLQIYVGNYATCNLESPGAELSVKPIPRRITRKGKN